MSKNWNYALLSKMAKEAGGPEKYAAMIEVAGRNAGRMEMVPLVIAAVVGSSLLTTATIKTIENYKSKNQMKLDTAKKKFIEATKQGNVDHSKENGEEKQQ